MDKKYDFQNTENELERFWEEQGIYKYKHGKDKKIYSIVSTDRKECMALYLEMSFVNVI